MKVRTTICVCILLLVFAPMALAGENKLPEKSPILEEFPMLPEPQEPQETTDFELSSEVLPEPEETSAADELSSGEQGPDSEPVPDPTPDAETTETPVPSEPLIPGEGPEVMMSAEPSPFPTPEQADVIHVSVPDKGQVILNPYGLDVEIDGGTSRAPVVSRSYPITNLSEIPISAHVSAVGVIPPGSGAAFADSIFSLPEVFKGVFLYLEFQHEPDAWLQQYQEAPTQMIITEEQSKQNDVLSLDPEETGYFRLFGGISHGSGWTADDSVDVSIVLSFSPK